MSGQAYTAAVLPRARSRAAGGRSGAGAALGVAVVCALALLLLWGIAEHVYAVEIRDTALLRDFTRLDGPHVGPVCEVLLNLLNPVQFMVWGVALVLIALRRERPRVAAAVLALMSLAPLSSELLKRVLAHPHVTVGWTHIGPVSFPSGHATAATALALSAVLVAPARLRALVATCGAGFMLVIGVALLIREWHLPSDVLGGYLMGALWAALAIAALRACERRWPARARRVGAAPDATARS
jgi:membrane-associated phospholipid phosphatase